LTAGYCGVLSQPSAVHADGGVGKTALAVELGWRLFEKEKFDFVLFLDASTPETLDAELAALCAAHVLDLPEQNAEGQKARRDSVIGWLHAPGNAPHTFLILDNADADDACKAVRELLPQVPGCAVLITSRHSVWSGMGEHELALFTPDESREYLRTHLQPGLLAKSSDERTLDAVAEEIDHLPLALELVVGYMHETRQSPAEWLAEWKKTPARTVSFHEDHSVNYPVSLARAWEQSFARPSLSARKLLHLFAWFASRPAVFPLSPFQTAGDWPRCSRSAGRVGQGVVRRLACRCRRNLQHRLSEQSPVMDRENEKRRSLERALGSSRGQFAFSTVDGVSVASLGATGAARPCAPSSFGGTLERACCYTDSES
jgi:hypothetical protein